MLQLLGHNSVSYRSPVRPFACEHRERLVSRTSQAMLSIHVHKLTRLLQPQSVSSPTASDSLLLLVPHQPSRGSSYTPAYKEHVDAHSVFVVGVIMGSGG